MELFFALIYEKKLFQLFHITFVLKTIYKELINIAKICIKKSKKSFKANIIILNTLCPNLKNTILVLGAEGG